MISKVRKTGPDEGDTPASISSVQGLAVFGREISMSIVSNSRARLLSSSVGIPTSYSYTSEDGTVTWRIYGAGEVAVDVYDADDDLACSAIVNTVDGVTFRFKVDVQVAELTKLAQVLNVLGLDTSYILNQAPVTGPA